MLSSVTFTNANRVTKPGVSVPQENSLITEMAQGAHRIASNRPEALFAKFLPCGYDFITLSCVPDELRDRVLAIKVAIGTLITLYDDLVDHPKLRDAQLAETLYALPFGTVNAQLLNHSPRAVFIAELWTFVRREIATLPHYDALASLFRFDVEQIYMAFRYSDVVSRAPEAFSLEESRSILHHNMGIVLVGTIDLMTATERVGRELGKIRTLLIQAQRSARIMNLLATSEREREEGDVTSELARETNPHIEGRIWRDMHEGIEQISVEKIAHFDAQEYAEGLRKLSQWHDAWTGTL